MVDISSGICPFLLLVAEQSWVSSLEDFEQAFLTTTSPLPSCRESVAKV
jgi:hypothetical protein